MRTATVGGKLVEVVDYDSRPHQRELDTLIWNRAITRTGPQFLVPVDHRRSGKSSGLVNSLIKMCASMEPSLIGQYYYFYPQQKKIREHLWDNPQILGRFLPKSQVQKKDDQRMVIFFKSGSQLIFDGTDEDPDKHRGGNGKAYVVDEYDDQKKRIFTEINRPIVEANGGVCVLSGTPRGVLHLHDAYQAGQDPTRPQWWSRLLPANISYENDGNRLFTDEQLGNIKRDYTAEGIGGAYEQEWLCAFIQGANQVFRRVEEVTLNRHGQILKEQEPIPNRYYQIGTDPALTSDYWVNSVLDLHTHEEVYLERFQPLNSELGEARTEALCRKYNLANIRLDEAGLGLPIADHMRSKSLPVEGLNTGTNKERLITNLSMIVDALSVRFLPDPVAMAEMRDYTFNRLPVTGRYQFGAPEGKHDDTVIARALATWELPAPLPVESDPRVWNPFEDPREKEKKQYIVGRNTYYGMNHKHKND